MVVTMKNVKIGQQLLKILQKVVRFIWTSCVFVSRICDLHIFCWKKIVWL